MAAAYWSKALEPLPGLGVAERVIRAMVSALGKRLIRGEFDGYVTWYGAVLPSWSL
jgi:hypothetical protein